MQQILLLRVTPELGTGMHMQYLRGWHDRAGCCAVGGLARENARPEAREVLQKKVTSGLCGAHPHKCPKPSQSMYGWKKGTD